MKVVSLVIPAHNEEANIPLIYKAIQEVFQALPAYQYEITIVDDGSTDGTAQAVSALAEQDKNVKLLSFTRNFGKEAATTAGIREAKGDAVVILDADLQHPPAHIPEMIQRWEAGAEVVVGIRISNEDGGMSRKFASALFYGIMKSISDVQLQPGETDFRLIDREVADEFNRLSEHQRMTRSLINWLGFKRETISFNSPSRMNGSASYSSIKLFRLALTSFLSNSLLPLRLAGYLGVFIVIFSGILGVTVLIEKYPFNDVLNWNVSGTAEIAIVNVFLIGIILIALGVIALYIENIHVETANRPMYVVRKQKASK